jgi:hypothetical protein
MTPKDLCAQGDQLFDKRTSLMLLWQEISENFYPERADFTASRTLGEEFAADLMTSYPLIVRRDLGNAFGSMLRPTAKTWFHARTLDERLDKDVESRRWLEWVEGVQRRAMYDTGSLFTRATKEGDHDFAAFGQCVLTVQLNREGNGLLYRSWHLRDVAWAEDEEGKIGEVHRKWKPTLRNLLRLFPNTVVDKLKRIAHKEPFREIDCRHMVVKADMCDGNYKTPFVSIFYDRENNVVLEERPIYHRMYVIPRWQTVSGSQYAYSPAAVAGLADARLIQAMTGTLLEAGEKQTNPPMIATQEAIRSDVNIYAGGITWVDREYDEKLGEVLRPLTIDKSGMPIGIEMQRDSRAMLMEAFFLNKLSMPDRGKAEMTAFEVGQHVQEYIRQALPIFEPMEMDYNGAICEETFDILLRGGAFGDPRNMPRMLRGADVKFSFASPLHDAIEAEKSHKLLESKALLADAIALDPTSAKVMDIKTAFRDALMGIGVPARWIRSEEEVGELEAQEAAAAQSQALLAAMQQGAEAAKTIGEAKQALAPA